MPFVLLDMLLVMGLLTPLTPFVLLADGIVIVLVMVFVV